MKINKLMLLVLPLLMCGCSNQEESKQYPAINDQQAIMKEYYRQHTSNQSYLNKYAYKQSLSYDPTYDVFGSLAPIANAKNLYYELTMTNNVNVYSGYFICNNKLEGYIGNKQNVGSKYEHEDNESFWFRAFEEEGHDGELELIHRHETKDNDLDKHVVDYHTGVGVESDNVSHYFSNNINTDYKDYFVHPLTQPTSSTTRQVSAYLKSETEIVETYKEVVEDTPIENPIHPGEEYRLTVMKQVVGKTTFKLLDKIGWAGTDFEETTTYALVSDYELKLLEQPRILMEDAITISFTYASSMQPYSGDAYVFQEEDTKIETYRPSLFTFDGANFVDENLQGTDVSKEYKKVHPEFSGYAYSFTSVNIEQGKLYSFAKKEDIEKGIFDSIGYNELVSSAGGTIVSGGVEGRNLIKTITTNETYEFIITISSTGNVSLIAQLHG